MSMLRCMAEDTASSGATASGPPSTPGSWPLDAARFSVKTLSRLCEPHITLKRSTEDQSSAACQGWMHTWVGSSDFIF